MILFSIADGRKQFFQWDTDVKLNVWGMRIGDEVHFYNKNSIVPYRVKLDINKQVVVPPELLQEATNITACGYDLSKTLRKVEFDVVERLKPADYVYTPTERITVESLAKDLQNKVDSGYFNGFSPTVEVLGNVDMINGKPTETGVTLNITDINGTQNVTIPYGKDYVLTNKDKQDIASIASGEWETLVDEVLTEDVTEIEYLFGKNYKKIVVQLTGENKALTATNAKSMYVCLNAETCEWEGEIYPVDILMTSGGIYSPFNSKNVQTTIVIDTDGICKATCYINPEYIEGNWYALPIGTNSPLYVSHGIAPYKHIYAIQLRNDENDYGFAAGLHISIKGVAI